MVSRLWTSGILLISCLTITCENRGPLHLRDTEGRTFEATCPKAGPCELVQRSGRSRPAKPEHILLTGSRLVGVCDLSPGAASEEGPFDCRALRCESNAECPPLHGMKEGQCLNGRCSDSSEPIRAQDAVMLCLAGTGLGRASAAQIERYALGLNCGSPCVVPAPCAQP